MLRLTSGLEGPPSRTREDPHVLRLTSGLEGLPSRMQEETRPRRPLSNTAEVLGQGTHFFRPRELVDNLLSASPGMGMTFGSTKATFRGPAPVRRPLSEGARWCGVFGRPQRRDRRLGNEGFAFRRDDEEHEADGSDKGRRPPSSKLPKGADVSPRNPWRGRS